MGQVQFLELNPNPNLDSTKKNQNWPTFVPHFTPYPRTLMEWEMSFRRKLLDNFPKRREAKKKSLC